MTNRKENMDYLISLVKELCNLPSETSWVEFKHNNDDPERIGQLLSALANSAALAEKTKGYLIWGIEDKTHEIVGTLFNPLKKKLSNEELENWLLRSLDPKIEFCFYSIDVHGKPVVLLEVSAACHKPVRFKGEAYIRIGSCTKKLKDAPEKERELWRIFDRKPFESHFAVENLSPDEVLDLLNYPSYFELLNLPLPDSHSSIMKGLISDELILPTVDGLHFSVTNMGALLLAKTLSRFPTVRHKFVRIILYADSGRTKAIREWQSTKGYAIGYEEIVDRTLTLLPKNEIMEKALRRESPMFPELAVREVIANALIHQDLTLTGCKILIEIFPDRMEVTNPGLPLVKTERFIDSPPRSRNEHIASLLRRMGVCEERGSGVDRIVQAIEYYQLPPPIFEVTDDHTRVVLFAHKEFKHMDKDERIRACYLHACLRYVQRSHMTNTSLRERFGIQKENSAIVSRMIKEGMEANVIKPYDPQAAKKYMKYVPYWA